MQKLKNPMRKIILLIPALCLLTAALVYFTLRNEYPYALLITSLLVLAFIPFFAWFELRRPSAGLLVCVAVMAAVAALSRTVFAALPSVKPVTAIVLVTGMAFGPSAGFMTGALAALTSNLYFGQGPWTPWQMLAWGLCGLLGGLLGDTKLMRSVWGMSFFGTLCAMAFGILMNSYHILMYVRPITIQAIAASAVAALPFDLLHAASTFVFLLLFGKLWLRKLERIQKRLGTG